MHHEYLEVVATLGVDGDGEGSQLAASEMLTANQGNVQGIYAADDTMVAGAIDAAKAQGLDVDGLIITSIGNTFLGNPLVASGELGHPLLQPAGLP